MVWLLNQDELKEYLEKIEEAKARDHRKLGKELIILFFRSGRCGITAVFTTRNNTAQMMSEYSLSLGYFGFEKVWTPHITKMDLFKASGHYAKFGDELFIVHSQVSGEDFALKPMNCPHHAISFSKTTYL